MNNTIDWSSKDLQYITGLYLDRYINKRKKSFSWKIIKCKGLDTKGREVDVILPFKMLPRYRMKQTLYHKAKTNGVFVHGLFDNIKIKRSE